MQRGCFITFEGTEGAGKSTQIRLLANRLKAAGADIVLVREPGGTTAGERIRDVLKDPLLSGQLNAHSELFLLSACRSELVRQVIVPALERGRIVLCDRFYDSTLAYQAYGRGLDLVKVREVVDYSTDGLHPDLTFFLEIPLVLSHKRRAIRSESADPESKTDRFEQSDDAFFGRVEEGFRELAAESPERIRIVDGSGSLDDVGNEIWRIVEQKKIVQSS